ncbi:MAG: PspC domain-containing protein [Alistipes sp.]|nr:PspC domain-containing protein [Alistipes sp.]
MNEIKRCSLSGVGFTLEREAYNRLNDYLQSLKNAYKNNPDSEEILADIEARIAELILSAQSSAENVVCLPLVENIIAQLGTPEAISGEEEEPKNDSSSRIPRRLYRDLENAKLGGVCAGLAKYFGVEAAWIRLAISSPLILLIIGAPYLHWLSIIGGNILGIFLITYLILWFAIPGAKSARQKLEQEGERISAQSIAERQGATQEEKAKSSVATAVTSLGKFMATLFKILLGAMLFPIAFVVFAMLIALIAITVGIGEMFVVDMGNFSNLMEATNEVGMPLMIFALLTVLVPAIYIAYLFIVLLINKRPRWWVLVVTLLVWFFLLLGTIFSGIAYAESESDRFFSSESEVMRIMKYDGKSNLSRQIMEDLNSAPDAEQQVEIERLKNDNNAQSIDK